MLETRMQSPWVYKKSKSQLPDMPEPLKPGMLNNRLIDSFGHIDKPVNRIVDYFAFGRHGIYTA
jgi:hypothetical protein